MVRGGQSVGVCGRLRSAGELSFAARGNKQTNGQRKCWAQPNERAAQVPVLRSRRQCVVQWAFACVSNAFRVHLPAVCVRISANLGPFAFVRKVRPKLSACSSSSAGILLLGLLVLLLWTAWGALSWAQLVPVLS